MLRVQRATQQDISPELFNDIYSHCLGIEADLQASLLSKHYSWFKLAHYLVTDATSNFMYILYDDDTPLGLMCFSEAFPVHMGCPCVAEDLLYIAPEHRTYRNTVHLIKLALQLLREEFRETFLVFVGSTLGASAMPKLYKRIGFSEVGTHLVTELEGTCSTSHKGYSYE